MKMEIRCGMYCSGSGQDSDAGCLWIQ